MKFGVREICEVVLKAKATQMLGSKKFYAGEPVMYFDTLKTSGLEGAATTVYAQGGRGNSRLIAWEGERTVTFTMEDALISDLGLSILTGADLIQSAASTNAIPVHVTEQTNKVTKTGDSVAITLDKAPYNATTDAYVMILNDRGEIITEPYKVASASDKVITIAEGDDYTPDVSKFTTGCTVLVDYYTQAYGTRVTQVDITPDKFGGNYYLEAQTLFRNTDGTDLPAEFIIPNCKVQSNFNFSLASSGDPSTFTFTMDAFPDYTRFDKTKKVLCAIQIIGEDTSDDNEQREATEHV